MNIFAMIAGIVIALGLIVLMLNKKLLGMMHGVK